MIYLRYNKTTREGTGLPDMQPEVLEFHKAGDPGFDYRPLTDEEFRHFHPGAPCILPAHAHKVIEDGSIVCKKHVEIAVDKYWIKGNGNDPATLTWSLGRPVNVKINGWSPSNNPHTDGLILPWDQPQHLFIEIDDPDYWGRAEVRST